MNATNNSQTRLGTEPLNKLMVSMAVPGIFAQIINILYSIVDRVYIGHIDGVGTNALTGVGLTFPILILFTAFAMIVGSGGAPLAAIALGKKDQDEAEKILGTGVFLLGVFAVSLMAVFFAFKRPFLYAFGASDSTIVFADAYLSIYLIGSFSVLLYMGLNQFIIAQGKPVLAMVSVGIGAILNLILDPIFIFALNLGVKGAAIATVISQTASAIWVLSILLNKKTSLRIKMGYVKWNWGEVKNIVSLGISPFIMVSTDSLIGIAINRSLSLYGGDIYVGSYTILQSVFQLVQSPGLGFTQGVQPIISYNYGAKNYARVRSTYRRMISTMFVYTFVFSLLTVVFPRFFAGLFTDEVEMINLVGEVMPIFMFGMLIFGLQAAIQPTFVALGQAKLSLFVASFRKILLLAPLAVLLPIKWGVMGVYYAEPISDILSVLTSTTLFLAFINKILKDEQTPVSENGGNK